MTGYLTLYESHITKIKQTGENQFIGSCCFHGKDDNPSFSFNAETGLYHCFVCGSGNAYQFAESVGIDPKPYSNGTPITSDNKPYQVSKEKRNGHTGENRDPILSDIDRKRAFTYHTHLLENFDKLTEGLPWTLEAVKRTWTGYDKNAGRFTFVHTNRDGKALNIKHHKGKGGEKPFQIKGYSKCRLYPLHLLKEYKATQPLIICEGEKDVITLQSKEFQAVTSTTGAVSFTKDISPLKEFKSIFILYDNDEAGRIGSVRLAKLLKKQFPQSKIVAARWNDVPEKYDITDHFSQGKDELDLLSEFGEILQSGKETHLTLPKKLGVFNIMTGKEASNTTPPPTEWIVKNILPKKFNSIIAGTTGSKKSFWAMQLGMSIANGEMEFCGNAIKQKLKVLYVDTEIGMDEFHRRYLRIKKYLNWTGDDNFLMISKSGEHADIWDDVHEVINYNNPDLLIIDSLYNSTTVDDFSKSAKMSRVTDAMTEFKDKYGISVLGVHHFNKGQHDQGLMIDRMQGSAVLQNWVEFLMIMISTNVDDFNLWTVGKTRGTFHDKSIIGLKWNDFWFKTVGIVEDYKPFLITEHKKKKWMTVLEDCPNQFSTSDWLNVFNSLFKLSERTGRTWLSECSNTPMVKRLGQGLYQKKLKLISEENEL